MDRNRQHHWSGRRATTKERCRIDLLTPISGGEFDEAWRTVVRLAVAGVAVAFLSRVTKRATGRPRDASDAAWLKEDD